MLWPWINYVSKKVRWLLICKIWSMGQDQFCPITNAQMINSFIVAFGLLIVLNRFSPIWVPLHYYDVIMGAIVSQITSLRIVYSIVYSGADQRKRQSSTSLAFVWGIHRWPVNSLHQGPVMQKMFPFDDVIMKKSWQKCVTLADNVVN